MINYKHKNFWNKGKGEKGENTYCIDANAVHYNTLFLLPDTIEFLDLGSNRLDYYYTNIKHRN